MNTAREVVAQVMYEYFPSRDVGEAADAVLAALREHWTSDVGRPCEVMHDAYEEAAEYFGWQMRSRQPWVDLPEANKAALRFAIAAVIAALFDDSGPA